MKPDKSQLVEFASGYLDSSSKDCEYWDSEGVTNAKKHLENMSKAELELIISALVSDRTARIDALADTRNTLDQIVMIIEERALEVDKKE